MHRERFCPRGRPVLVGTAREIGQTLKHSIKRAFAHPTYQLERNAL
jgi:hypothetical protein